MLLEIRDRLAYPAGRAPGADYSHPALSGCVLSAVPSTGSFVSLLSGARGIVNGVSVAGGIDGRLGPVTSFPGNGNVSFPGSNGGKTTLTIAAIFTLTALSGSPAYIINDSAVGVNGIGYNLTLPNNFLGYISGNSFGSNNPFQTVGNPAVGVPFFLAFSANGQVGAAVVVRLDTGQIWLIPTSVAIAPGLGDGTLYIGNRGTNSRNLAGSIAAVMYSTAALSLQQLEQWAEDPWSFWYPRNEPEMLLGQIASLVPYNPWPQAAPILAQ